MISCLFVAFFQPNESAAQHQARPSISLLPRRSSVPKIYSEVADETSIGRIVISVIDSGPGLTAEQQRSLFLEGVQFNPNELQAGQGSGLGLWIAREIVSLHQGDITVRSQGLGMGATFVLSLPVYLRDTQSINSCTRRLSSQLQSSVAFNSIVDIPDPPPDPAVTTSPAAASTPVPSAPLRVLVVDDAVSNRKLVCRLLQSKGGFICQQAENGQECVNMVLSGDHPPFDLILMDYEMPIMNGPSAAYKLREMKCEILIIGLTGNVLPEDREYFMSQGANAVLPKPVDIKALLECISAQRAVTEV